MIFSKNRGLWIELSSIKDLKNKLNKRYICSFDFDGVITDPWQMKSEEFRSYGFELLPEETTRQNALRKNIPIDIYEKVTESVNVKRLNRVPLQSKITELLEFLSAKYNIIIISRRENSEVESALEYIDNNELWIDGFINVFRKLKFPIIKELNPEFYVDDNLTELKEMNKTDTKLLYFGKDKYEGNDIFSIENLDLVKRFI